MKNNTKKIALEVAKLCDRLPGTRINNVYISQILRCSASVGANYRAACRAKSSNDFVYKLRVVEEEADETLYFLELLAAFNPSYKIEMRKIHSTTEMILKIIVSSIITAMKRKDYRPGR